MILRLLSLLICSVFFSSCASDIYFKRDVNIQQLGVKLTYKDKVYPELQKVYESELDTFIQHYNAEKHLFKLYSQDSVTNTAIEVQIEEHRLVPVGRQILTFPLVVASATTIAGLAMVPYTIPHNKTKVTVLFTGQLCEPKHITKNLLLASSGAYFGGEKAQLRKHKRKIRKQYVSLFATIEKAYQQHLAFYKKK